MSWDEFRWKQMGFAEHVARLARSANFATLQGNDGGLMILRETLMRALGEIETLRIELEELKAREAARGDGPPERAIKLREEA